MKELDYDIDYEKAHLITIDDALKNQYMVQDINYLVNGGFIDLEEDDAGNIRAYPTGR